MFSDEKKKAVGLCAETSRKSSNLRVLQDLGLLLKTVTQRITHFPREAVRALFAEDLRSRVYLKRPPKYFRAVSV